MHNTLMLQHYESVPIFPASIFFHTSLAFHNLSLRFDQLMKQPWECPEIGPILKPVSSISTSSSIPTNARFEMAFPFRPPTRMPCSLTVTTLPNRRNSARTSSGTAFAFSDTDMWRAFSRNVSTCQPASISQGNGSPDTHSFLSISNISSSVSLKRRRETSKFRSPRWKPIMSSPPIRRNVPEPTTVTVPKSAAQ